MSTHRWNKKAPPEPQPQHRQSGAGESEGPGCIDFFSPQFNRVDELDDSLGNYREFETLHGVVTADMRFREQRRRQEQQDETAAPKPTPGPEEPGEKSETGGERGSPAITIVSAGRVLILASDECKARRCAEVLSGGGLTCSICITGDNGENSGTEAPVVHGCFGGFTVDCDAVKMMRQKPSASAGPLSGTAGLQEHFDLVLDLQPFHSYTGTQLPLGYFDVGEDESILPGAMVQMTGLKGRFRKPRFVAVRAERCLRGRHNRLHCDRCMHVCPFMAVGMEDAVPVVDHYRCQGCGACRLVCSAGAMTLMHPRPEEFTADICSRLREWTSTRDARPHVLLVDGQLPRNRSSSGDDQNDIFVHYMDEIGRLDLDTLLALLAVGAGSVAVFCDEQCPEGLRLALSRMVGLGREILEGLELPADHLQLHVASSDENVGLPPHKAKDCAILPALSAAADFDFGLDSLPGDTLRRAVCHLDRLRGKKHTALALSPGAPFGSLDVNGDCSLCMACAGSCPAGALSAGGNLPRLHLVEASCHQCGLCSMICPEEAITLRPRLVVDDGAARSPAVIREVDAFCCVECGEPFAARSMVERMQQSLAGHWMFKEERQRRRLQMCAGCRTQDALVERGM